MSAGSIEVTVSDVRTRQPLAGAALTVTPGPRTGKPGSDPSVLTASVEPGRWTVEVTHPGYDPFHAQHVVVQAFNKTAFKVSLHPAGAIT